MSSHRWRDLVVSAAVVAAVPFVWFAARPAYAADVDVAVDLDAVGRNISPAIYGVSFAGEAELTSVPYPANRWGGNSVTRYNWQADVSNRASDWFFMNIPEASVDPAQLPDGSTADVFVAESVAGGSQPLMTLPLIGWTSLGVREKRWGFSVAKYGAQDETECTATGGAFWCQPDAGNGYAGGDRLTGNDPADTSMAPPTASSPMVSRVGTPRSGRALSPPVPSPPPPRNSRPDSWES